MRRGIILAALLRPCLVLHLGNNDILLLRVSRIFDLPFLVRIIGSCPVGG